MAWVQVQADAGWTVHHCRVGGISRVAGSILDSRGCCLGEFPGYKRAAQEICTFWVSPLLGGPSKSAAAHEEVLLRNADNR